VKGLVLIADDDTAVSALLERHLVSLGCQVTTVADGVQAVLKAKEIHPNLIILDIQMPGAYGTSVYENLRKDDATRSTPVLFMSGSLAEASFRSRIAADASNRFLKKPFDLTILTQNVRELLGDKAT
jgi:two-component system alkaline phosphatase synthesis response regulator PhoP